MITNITNRFNNAIGRFHIGTILAIHSGLKLSPDGYQGIRGILNYMSGDLFQTIELPYAAEKAKPVLEIQLPWLKTVSDQVEIDYLCGILKREGIECYVESLARKYGRFHSITPLEPSHDRGAILERIRGTLRGKKVIGATVSK